MSIKPILLCWPLWLSSSFISASYASPPTKPVTVPTQAIPITVTTATASTLEVTITAMGELESPEKPMVAAEIAGKILKLTVDEGDAVAQGQVLAELDKESYQIQLEQANAEVQRLTALISNQQVTVKRFQDLLKQRSVAQNELDKAQTDLAISQAQVVGAQAKIKEVHYYLAKSQIVSPVNGIVQQRFVSRGDYVNPGVRLFQIVVTDNLRARLFLPETVATQAHLGLPVRLSLGHREEKAEPTITATISRLRPMLEATSRALEVLVDFPNEKHWKPGYSVKGVIMLEQRQNAVLIPETSLVRRPAGEVVYLINEDHAKQRIVQTGLRKGDLIEILTGLKAGEKIVMDGAGFLSDGAKINLRSTQP
jgi:RND family efflux transporter MFP subunit